AACSPSSGQSRRRRFSLTSGPRHPRAVRHSRRSAHPSICVRAYHADRAPTMFDAAAATGMALVIGGTGVFGRLIVADLLTHTTLSIAVASRHGVAPRGWLPGSEGRVTSTRLDARREHALRAAIDHTQADVVVHAAGPYALIGDAPLRAALGARIPYVDMCPRSDLFAELRERYDAAAQATGVTCIVGASTAGGVTGLRTGRG